MAQSEARYPIMDVDDYLVLDRGSKQARYEYLDGELRMLAGGSNYHARIAAHLATVINRCLEEQASSCYVYSSDVRLQLSASRYVYADVTVSCDERDEALGDMLCYPRVVIEVLSPSTEAHDRGRKALYYRECPTVEEYVLVDSLSISVEVFHREADGWMMRSYGPGSVVELKSLALRFPITSIYRGMKLIGTRAEKKDRAGE
jgi:Uma2 family endonuclease